MKILFLHGWHSVPDGVKPTYLAQHGHTAFNPKLPDEDFAEAVKIAQDEFDKHQPDVVVGSSRGGAVAMTALTICFEQVTKSYCFTLNPCDESTAMNDSTS